VVQTSVDPGVTPETTVLDQESPAQSVAEAAGPQGTAAAEAAAETTTDGQGA
jgi:hypothetical protein